MKIQEQAQKYRGEYKVKTIADANILLNLYAQISFDEGYRVNMEETKKDITYSKIKIKNRRKGWFEYIDDGDIEKVYPLTKRRIASKRMRKSQLDHWAEQDKGWDEELFTLSMVMHTFFEAGYLKADTIEEQAKIICGENSDIVLEMFNTVFKDVDLDSIDKELNKGSSDV